MDHRRTKTDRSKMEVKILICDIRAEINLDGLELLKLEIGMAGTRLMCTTGTLWLTQEGDPHDHLLKAGQSFSLDQAGIVLVQGLPCGKALLLPPASRLVKEPAPLKSNCSDAWEQAFEAE